MAQYLRKITTHKDVYPGIAPETYSREDFLNKVVIVTGSGGGIGKATGLAFSELGARVAFTDLALKTAQAAADEATQTFGNKTIATAGDVRCLEDMEKLVAETREKLGPIDCVVFAAGYGMFDRFEVSRSDDWWGLVETNLKGPVDLTRLVLPEMKNRNTGTLIYVASRVHVQLTNADFDCRPELLIMPGVQLITCLKLVLLGLPEVSNQN
jgi:NADP-dependent 3-hydroxy acid dehydrogenase YdfG